MNGGPLFFEIRVFEADHGWRYELKIWRGDVDVRNAAPSDLIVSKRRFVTRISATLMAFAAAERMVTP